MFFGVVNKLISVSLFVVYVVALISALNYTTIDGLPYDGNDNDDEFIKREICMETFFY